MCDEQVEIQHGSLMENFNVFYNSTRIRTTTTKTIIKKKKNDQHLEYQPYIILYARLYTTKNKLRKYNKKKVFLTHGGGGGKKLFFFLNMKILSEYNILESQI